MSCQVKDVYYAFPHGLSPVTLANGYGLGERSRAAMHAFNGDSELVGVGRNHADKIPRR
jgi:hypothetical protein